MSAVAWCKENRDAFYGAAAYLLILAGFPWSMVGCGIIGHIAAHAWAWRKYGRRDV